MRHARHDLELRTPGVNGRSTVARMFRPGSRRPKRKRVSRSSCRLQIAQRAGGRGWRKGVLCGVEIGAERMTRDARRGFDFQDVPGRQETCSTEPAVDGLLRYANGSSKSALGTHLANSSRQRGIEGVFERHTALATAKSVGLSTATAEYNSTAMSVE